MDVGEGIREGEGSIVPRRSKKKDKKRKEREKDKEKREGGLPKVQKITGEKQTRSKKKKKK